MTVNATDTSPRHARQRPRSRRAMAAHKCAGCMWWRGGGEPESSPPGGISVAVRRHPICPTISAAMRGTGDTERPLRRVRGASHLLHGGGVDERASQCGCCLVAHIHDGQGLGERANHVGVRAAHRDTYCLRTARSIRTHTSRPTPLPHPFTTNSHDGRLHTHQPMPCAQHTHRHAKRTSLATPTAPAPKGRLWQHARMCARCMW